MAFKHRLPQVQVGEIGSLHAIRHHRKGARGVYDGVGEPLSIPAEPESPTIKVAVFEGAESLGGPNDARFFTIHHRKIVLPAASHIRASSTRGTELYLEVKRVNPTGNFVEFRALHTVDQHHLAAALGHSDRHMLAVFAHDD